MVIQYSIRTKRKHRLHGWKIFSIFQIFLSSNCCRRNAKLLAALLFANMSHIAIVGVGPLLYLSVLQPHAHTWINLNPVCGTEVEMFFFLLALCSNLVKNGGLVHAHLQAWITLGILWIKKMTVAYQRMPLEGAVSLRQISQKEQKN